MRRLGLVSLTFLLLLLTSTLAHARCEGAAMLGQLHDAYLASLIETGNTRINGARTLLVVVGGKNAGALSRQVRKSGIEIPEERLLAVMQSGAKLAHSVLLGIAPTDDLFDHSRNVDWLGSIVHKVNCQTGITATNVKKSAPSKDDSTFEFTLPKKQDLPFVGVAAVAVAAAIALIIRLILKSRTFRVRKIDRLPRSPFSMKFNLTITDQNGEMQQTTATGVDLSAGGMKLDWPNGPPEGTTVTVSMPFGEKLASVVWSNAYFAGIMFDDVLSKHELSTLRDNSAAAKKTAPEGAASKVQA